MPLVICAILIYVHKVIILLTVFRPSRNLIRSDHI